MIAVDTSQVAPPAVAGSVKSTGAQLVAAFPPRPVASSWPATEVRRSGVVDRVLSAPFALDNPTSQRNRRLGCWRCWAPLRGQPSDSWQQQWRASGAEDHPDWRSLISTDRANPLPHMSAGLLVLNPPYGFDTDMAAALAPVAAKLGAQTRLDWMAGGP